MVAVFGETQIPFGDDSQKSKGKCNRNSRCLRDDDLEKWLRVVRVAHAR